MSDPSTSRVRHVLLVCFHHQYGPMVEYAYPPLPMEKGRAVLPVEWKDLPFISLPDGVHHFEQEYTYFIVADPENKGKKLFGVACYRQMESQKLVNRGPDITRSTVQKSICVLTSLPLFGYVRTKTEMVTHAFFEQYDFSKKELLEELYNSLHVALAKQVDATQLYLALPLQNLLRTFKHELILIFKLLLLECKVILHSSVASDAATAVLALASLIPGLTASGYGSCLEASQYLTPASYEAEAEARLKGVGLPLRLYATETHVLQPYAVLQQISMLKDPAMNFFAGTSNMLLTQSTVPADAVIMLDQGTIDLRHPGLKHRFSVSNADFRFMEEIVSLGSEHNPDSVQ
eukprot:Colp12_sorted_trinity150504_noHs@17514